MDERHDVKAILNGIVEADLLVAAITLADRVEEDGYGKGAAILLRCARPGEGLVARAVINDQNFRVVLGERGRNAGHDLLDGTLGVIGNNEDENALAARPHRVSLPIGHCCHEKIPISPHLTTEAQTRGTSRPPLFSPRNFRFYSPLFASALRQSSGPPMTRLAVLYRIGRPHANSADWRCRTTGPGSAAGTGKTRPPGGTGDSRATRNLLAGSCRAAHGERPAGVHHQYRRLSSG